MYDSQVFLYHNVVVKEVARVIRSDYINNKNYYHSVTNEVAGEKYICGGTRHD